MKRSAIDRLVRAVRGEVVGLKAPGYDEARRIFNLEAQGRPAIIVRCLDAADVQAAVCFARDEAVPLAIRAGGHSVGGFSASSGALVLDLRACNQISADPAGTLDVDAGCTWEPVLDALGSQFAISGGFDPRVGVAGLTLGGGYGLLTRMFGLASDSLLSAEVVTADGERRVASATEEPELFWALRGAGANFGVTTSLRLQVRRVPPLQIADLTFPLGRAKELLLAYRELVAGLPDAMTLYLTLDTSEQVQFKAFHLGDPAEGERLLAPLARLGRPTVALAGGCGYRSLHQPGLDSFPEHHHHVWRSHFVRALEDGAIEQIADHLARAGRQQFALVIEHLGGAFGRIPGEATAFAHRAAVFGLVSAVRWKARTPRPAAALKLQESLHRALAPGSIGTYVNYLGRNYTPRDVAAAYGANLSRLQTLKRRYDPENLFRNNVNI